MKDALKTIKWLANSCVSAFILFLFLSAVIYVAVNVVSGEKLSPFTVWVLIMSTLGPIAYLLDKCWWRNTETYRKLMEK